LKNDLGQQNIFTGASNMLEEKFEDILESIWSVED